MKKVNKYLIIGAVAIDVAVTLFLFVISIIMLAMIGKYGNPKEAINHASGLILFLLKNTTVYFWAFVFPLFILLAANIVGLVFYVKKTSVKEANKEQTKLDDLSDAQKEALKAELLKDLQKNIENK